MNKLLEQLGYNGVILSLQEVVHRYPNYQDLTSLGVDEYYFMSGHPVAIFYKTDKFDEEYTKNIAEVLHKAWNYNKIFLLIAYSDFEVRVYNCHSKPYYVSKDSEYEKEIRDAQIDSSSLNDSNFTIFASIFSREGLDTGALWKVAGKKIKIDISKRIDAYLVECLDKTKEKLLEESLPEKYIHAILLRSLFVLFLEDKGATGQAGIYSSILPGSNSYLDILNDKEATYKLFSILSKQFNGDIAQMDAEEENFVKPQHLKFIRRCFLDGDLSDNPKIFGDWRLFRFDIIRIELLSEIYEHFLGKTKALRGQYYTPTSLVDLVLDGVLPMDSTRWNIKVLDPACGSGIFLVKSYSRLITRWKKANNKKIDFETLRSILCNSIYGLDIDPTAITVAAFSLYLTLINELDPRTLWTRSDHKLPHLIHYNAEEKVEGNLWCCDTIATDFRNLLPSVDLVVGNPPYSTKHKQNSIKKYCKAHHFANEMSLPFIQKATTFCPSGEIALVVNMKILTNTSGTYNNFRKWLLNDAYVKKIYNFSIFRKAPKKYGGRLFSSASTPVAVIFYKTKRPKIASENVVYWAPRTYMKVYMSNTILLEGSDVKYIPRELCESGNTSIWKIGAWGNELSLNLIHKLNNNCNLFDTFKNSKWLFSKGYNSDRNHQDYIPEYFLDNISRYCIDDSLVILNEKKKPYRKISSDIFKAPFVVMKQSPSNDGLVASICKRDAVTTTSTFIFNGMSYEEKVMLVCYLNSKIANIYVFLTASSWGVERECLVLKEVMNLPSPFEIMSESLKKSLISLYQQICKRQGDTLQSGIDDLRKEIDAVFYKTFGLTSFDIDVVEDLYSNSLKLFIQKDKSETLKPAVFDNLKSYVQKLCESLNNYYQFSDTKVSPSILVPNPYDAFDMVTIKFDEKEGKLEKLNNQQYKLILRQLYSGEVSKEKSNIIIKRIFRIYESDKITLIKPNQKRYWTKIQAIEDAASIFSEILSMNDDDNE